jgi:hyperosmotically inducible periplasmic protein
MRMLIVPAIAATLFAASVLAENPNSQADHNDAFMPGPDNEAQLAKQVRHKLLTLPYYSIFDDLAFRVNGGVVTLVGACPPEPPWNIKSAAEKAVKSVPGVTMVINNIKELPLSPMDWDIRRAVARAIYGDPSIGMRYGYQALPSIHIIVDHGHVTLEGVVDNQFDHTLIRTRANSVPNVFSVTDNLRVLNESENKNKNEKKKSS